MIVVIYSDVMPSTGGGGTPAAFSFSAVTSGIIALKIEEKNRFKKTQFLQNHGLGIGKA